MVRFDFLSYIRGYVRCEIKGGRLETLLNSMLAKRYDVWNVRRIDGQTVQMHITVHDFFRLKPLLKETGSRVHVLERFGLPFLLVRLGKRKSFVAGLFFFIAGLYLLSSVVWSVRIETSASMEAGKVRKAAEELGIRPLQWKFRLPEPGVLSRQLMNRLEGAAWVGVEMTGTVVRIKVVESTRPEKSEQAKGPQNIVASHHAMVTKIIAQAGRPVVQVNRYVKKGDILISGVIGNDENRKLVAAKGEVYGLVWEKAVVEVPLSVTRKTYTGEKKKRHYLVLGGRALRLTGHGTPFERYEAVRDLHKLRWRNLELPLGWMGETLYEVKEITEKTNPAEGQKKALELARANVLLRSPEGIIRHEQVLKSKVGKESLVMEILFELERDIAAAQPISETPPAP